MFFPRAMINDTHNFCLGMLHWSST